jgi:hypothetical protein
VNGSPSAAAVAIRALLFVAALVPVWIFWSLTPVLLVRDGGWGLSYLALAGLAGVVIDGTILPLAARILFPPLLMGWTGLGQIGVAMALMTWCGVIGIGWVVTACVGAVLWERTAPSETVIDSQTDLTPTLPEEVCGIRSSGEAGALTAAAPRPARMRIDRVACGALL